MRRRLSLVIVLLLGAGFCLFTGWLVTRRPALPTQRAADGSTVTLFAVTRGKRHRYVHGSWWQQAFGPFLGEKLRRTGGGGVYERTAETGDALVFWTLHRTSTAPGLSGAGRVTIAGDAGTMAAVGEHRETQFLSEDGRMWLAAWEVHAWPRRSRRMTVAFSEGSGSALRELARFEVPVPAGGPYPRWTPEPLPAARMVGDRRVVLTELTTGLCNTKFTLARSGPMTRVTLRGHRTGRDETDWRVDRVALADATGNTAPLDTVARESGEDRESLTGFGGLWADETPWRVRVTLQRSKPAQPWGRWQIRRLPLPPESGIQGHAVKRTLHKHRVELVGATGAGAWGANGAPPAVNGVSAMVRGATNVLLKVAPALNDYELSVERVVDERGRPIGQQGTGWSGDGQVSIGLAPPRGARSVDLTLALRKIERKTVEFTVSPRLARK